ncbi:MAG: divergent PAP2 family protein [Candidatus Woesearchaeota archaeon]
MQEFFIIIFTVFLAYFTAQLLKIFTHKKLSFKDFLFGTGGTPSAHTSAIVSLPIIIFLLTGLSIHLAISLILMVLVIRDSLGVRYAVGENAIILKKKFPKEKVIISEGHTIKDVVAGALIGIIISLMVFLWLNIF